MFRLLILMTLASEDCVFLLIFSCSALESSLSPWKGKVKPKFDTICKIYQILYFLL